MSIQTPFHRRPIGSLLACVVLANLLGAKPVPAQEEPSSDPTGFFTELVNVRVINVEVFVSDRRGTPVTGLGPEDFELEVDGQVMPITNFYAEAGGRARESEPVAARAGDSSFRPVEVVAAEAPRRSYVVLLLDHTRLSANNRKRTLRSIREALQTLGPEDLVAVVGIEGNLVFYSDFLYDRQAVDGILEDATRVAVRGDNDEVERRLIFGELTRGQSGGIMARQFSSAESGAVLSRIQAYAAQEYERGVASLKQIEHVVSTLAGVPGRKMLLYVSDGIPTRPGEGLFVEWRNRFGAGTPNAEIGVRRIDFNTDYLRAVGRFDLSANMENLARAANRGGVTLYSIDAEGDHGGIIRSALTEQGATSEALSLVNENYREPLEFASKATGGRYLTSSGKLGDQLAAAMGDLDAFYSLGFLAPEEWPVGTDHNIQVRVKGRGLLVRHREEVRLPETDEREASSTLAALRFQTAGNGLEIRAMPGPATRREDGASVIPVALEIPIAKLAFLPRAGAQAGSLSIYVSTKSASGELSKVQKIPFHLAIPDEMMDRALTDRARYDLPVIVRPDDEYVAIGVRDNVGGGFSTIRLNIAALAR